MAYIDGCVIPVPTANKERYRKQAEDGWALFKEYGALSQHEYWSDDVPEGKLTSMHLAVQRKEGESIVYGWVVWPSKQVRDEAWVRMKKDGRMAAIEMPFDGSRMIFGGFESLFTTER